MRFVLDEKVTASSIRKFDDRVEWCLVFSDELMRTCLMVLWELMKPSWCRIANADSIMRVTLDIQIKLNADCKLRDLNSICNLMTTAFGCNPGTNVELPGWGPEDWVKPGSCLEKVFRPEGYMCGGLDWVITLVRQHEKLLILLGNIRMGRRTDTVIKADFHGGTEKNLVTALRFYYKFGYLESLLNR